MSIKILPPTRHIFRSKGDGDSKDLKALMDTRNKHIPREGGRERGRGLQAGQWSFTFDVTYSRYQDGRAGARAQSGGRVCVCSFLQYVPKSSQVALVGLEEVGND